MDQFKQETFSEAHSREIILKRLNHEKLHKTETRGMEEEKNLIKQKAYLRNVKYVT